MTVVMKERRGGMRIVGSGGGGKGGGGSARTPVESPDSLHNTSYAAVLDVIGNGEMAGPAHPSQPLRDIYLDGTPLQNADGTLNFSRVQVDYRVGTVDQEHIPGFPASASVTQVGTEITVAQPWVQALTNTNLSAARVSIHAPSLVRAIETGQNAGDRVGYRVDYAVDLSIGGGSYAQVVVASLDGKTVNGYTRTHRIDLPENGTGWAIRVRRLTPEAGTSVISDKIFVQSYAEVIDGKFVHPMTALVGIKIDAEQFQSIPTRAYHWRGQIIRVPSNYDPLTRTYSGAWDGTFKRAWSNNPAWIYFDMLTNKLYGLGDRIDASMIDRYALYQIGAYCDQLVPDGMGGQEPRFVCNVYLQSQADALRVLNDLTSAFRGMAYWANGQVVAVADAPSDPVYTYTNGNVIDGRFEYAGAELSTLKTVALVSWNDPSDFYRPKVEVVEDDDGIRRYGIRKTEVVAFGCTSRGQAKRVGLYHLYTSRMETGGVSFSVGMDGVIPQPGSVVRVADRNRAGRQIGGRIRQATANAVTLDRDSHIKAGDSLTVNLPDGTVQSRTVQLVSDRVITVSPAFSQIPAAESVWSVDSDDLVTQMIRIVSIRERDGITFDIEGVFHHPGKYAAIDSGVRLDPLPVSVVPPRAQLAPTNIIIAQHHTFHQGTTRHYAEISWDAPEYATLYDVQWRRDSGDWVQMPRTGTRLVEIADIYAGMYVVRVRAINSLDVPSLWAYSAATGLDGLVGAPPVVTHLTTTGEVMAIRVDLGYPATPNIIEKVQLRASLTNSFTDSYMLTEMPYPGTSYMMYGLGYSTEVWFWARLIDKNGTPGDWYPASTGAGVYGKPSNNYDAVIEALTGQINSGMLAPGLAEQIAQDAAKDVQKEILGELAGDDVLDDVWYAGDEDVFVGTVTTTSAINAGDYFEAKRTVSLIAQVGDSLAVIREVQRVQANETMALAERVTTLAAQVGPLEAVVLETAEAIAETNGALRATWGVKTQVRAADGRVAWTGMAQGAAINADGTVRSEIILAANIIALASTVEGPLTYPFIFDTVEQTAIFNTALIKELHGEKIIAGTLDADRITTASFTAKVASIEQAYVDYMNLVEGSVRTLHVADANITRLKIGQGAATAWHLFERAIADVTIPHAWWTTMLDTWFSIAEPVIALDLEFILLVESTQFEWPVPDVVFRISVGGMVIGDQFTATEFSWPQHTSFNGLLYRLTWPIRCELGPGAHNLKVEAYRRAPSGGDQYFRHGISARVGVNYR